MTHTFVLSRGIWLCYFFRLHNYGPFPKYSVLATGYAQVVATFNPSYVVFYIMGSSDHITHGHNVTQEFQMEPSDSELFASGLYTAMFIWPKSILFGS
jgi:hypothetical protein